VWISTAVGAPVCRRSSAVVNGRITALAIPCSDSRPMASPSTPMTVNGWSLTNTVGASSMRLMPSSFAAPPPRTATLSCRAMWPSSKNRPCLIVAPSTCGNAEPVATAGKVRSVTVVGSCRSLARTRALDALSGRATATADSTPFSRVSWGSAAQLTNGGWVLSRWSGTDTVTSVALAASNRPAIWLPAVAATPSVITSVVIPSTVPRTVSADRSGRAATPASASPARSRQFIDGLTSGHRRRSALAGPPAC
jgi:hypothetical protein